MPIIFGETSTLRFSDTPELKVSVNLNKLATDLFGTLTLDTHIYQERSCLYFRHYVLYKTHALYSVSGTNLHNENVLPDVLASTEHLFPSAFTRFSASQAANLHVKVYFVVLYNFVREKTSDVQFSE